MIASKYNVYFLIAKNQFLKILENPVVLLVGTILLILSYLNGAGGYVNLQSCEFTGADMFLQGYAQTHYSFILICSVMASFIGVTSISEERWTKSINVLLVKPLYRRDVILGKFIGISMFMLLFISTILLFETLMLTLFFRPPLDVMGLVWRLILYILALTLTCTMETVISMLCGIIFKNYLGSISVVITYLTFEWYWYRVAFFSKIPFITPYTVYSKIINSTGTFPAGIFNTTVPLYSWLSSALPYLTLLTLSVLALLIIDCFAVSRIDSY